MQTERERSLAAASRTPSVFTRRGILKAAGGTLAAAVPALSSIAPRTAAQATSPGGTLVAALVAEPYSLDPNQLTDINSMRLVRNIYDGLTGFEPGTFEIKPLLAESWEIAEDGLTYTFK